MEPNQYERPMPRMIPASHMNIDGKDEYFGHDDGTPAPHEIYCTIAKKMVPYQDKGTCQECGRTFSEPCTSSTHHHYWTWEQFAPQNVQDSFRSIDELLGRMERGEPIPVDPETERLAAEVAARLKNQPPMTKEQTEEWAKNAAKWIARDSDGL